MRAQFSVSRPAGRGTGQGEKRLRHCRATFARGTPPRSADTREKLSTQNQALIFSLCIFRLPVFRLLIFFPRKQRKHNPPARLLHIIAA